MQRYVARRLVQAVFVLVGISVVAFALTHVIGDPVVLLLPFQASQAQVIAMQHMLGLDQPLPVQYLRFARAVLHGDFGISVRQNTPALSLVLDRVPATAELASAALVIAVGVAVPLGIDAALRRRTIIDRGVCCSRWWASRCRRSGWACRRSLCSGSSSVGSQRAASAASGTSFCRPWYWGSSPPPASCG